MENKNKLNILIGDITSDEILKGHDLIVNPTNPAMICGGGVSGAIFYKAGVTELERYTQDTFDIHYGEDNYNEKNLMKVGEVRITPGFNLGMDIMFVQGPKKHEYLFNGPHEVDSQNHIDVLLNTYMNLLRVAYDKNYKHILLPSLGTGIYGYSHKEVGKEVYSLLNRFIKDKDISIDLVIYDEKDSHYYHE